MCHTRGASKHEDSYVYILSKTMGNRWWGPADQRRYYKPLNAFSDTLGPHLYVLLLLAGYEVLNSTKKLSFSHAKPIANSESKSDSISR